MSRHYQDTETRRRQVAEAALETIIQDGISHFTTRAIAGRVGISDGTLFRHFGSKQEIVLEAMGLLGTEIEAGLIATGNPMDDLEGFFRHRAAFVGVEGAVGRLIFSDEFGRLAGEEGQAQVEIWREHSVGYLIDRLKKLQLDERVRTDIDVTGLSMLVQGVLLTFAMQGSLGRAGTAEDLRPQIDTAWATLRTILLT